MESEPRGADVAIFPVTRGEAEVSELRRCCLAWRDPPERFWEFDDVLRALGRPGSLALYAAAAVGAPWRGVVFADVGPFTADLLYIYVMRDGRRLGVGRALLRALFTDLARRPQIEALLLEVRESNSAAQLLYRELGLTQVGRRKAYYANGEDALVLRREFLRDVPS